MVTNGNQDTNIRMDPIMLKWKTFKRISTNLVTKKFEFTLNDIYLMLKELPDNSIESIGKISCRNVTSTTKEASSDHDLKYAEAHTKEVNEVTHDVYNRNTNTNRFRRNSGGIKPSFNNNKRCQECGYSNDVLSKILNRMNPCNNDYCFMRGPKFNNNKRFQEKLL